MKVLLPEGYFVEWVFAHHGVLDAEVAFLQKPFSPTALARKVRELAGMSFVERGHNVVILGPPGVGKTHATKYPSSNNTFTQRNCHGY